MQRNRKWVVVAIMLLFSCKMGTIIPEKDMVSILVKMYIIDASVGSPELSMKFNDKDTIDYYSKTIQSFGYSQSQFDSSLVYYARKPKELDAIYDKVIIELSKIETRIATQNQQYYDSVNRDTSKNLWGLKNLWAIPNDGSHNTVDFEIKTVGLGVYTISADIMLYPDDESVNPSMTAYFYFDDKSTNGNRSVITSKSYAKSENTQTYSIQLTLHNSLVTHLKGSILGHSNTSNDFVKHADASNIKIHYKPLSKKSVKAKRFKEYVRTPLD